MCTGWTPLHEACNHGFLDVAKCLLKGGAHVNAQGADNDTPLHDAAINGNPDLVKLLLRFGADAHQANSAGRTPLDVAANGDIAKLLLLRKKELFSGSSSDSEYDVGSKSPQPSSPDSVQPELELELELGVESSGAGSAMSQKLQETARGPAAAEPSSGEQSPSRWAPWSSSGSEPKRAKLSLSFPSSSSQRGTPVPPHGDCAEGAAAAASAAALLPATPAVAATHDTDHQLGVPLTATRLMVTVSSPVELLASLPLIGYTGAAGSAAVSTGAHYQQQQPPPPHPQQPHAASAAATAALQTEGSCAKEPDCCDMEVEAIVWPTAKSADDASTSAVTNRNEADARGPVGNASVGSSASRTAFSDSGQPQALASSSSSLLAGAGAAVQPGVQHRVPAAADGADSLSPAADRGSAGRQTNPAPDAKGQSCNSGSSSSGSSVGCGSAGTGSGGSSGVAGTDRRGSMHSQPRPVAGNERASSRERRDRDSRSAAAIAGSKDGASEVGVPKKEPPLQIAKDVPASAATAAAMAPAAAPATAAPVPAAATADPSVSSQHSGTSAPGSGIGATAAAANVSESGSKSAEKEHACATRSSRVRDRMNRAAAATGSTGSGCSGVAASTGGAGSGVGSSSGGSSSGSGGDNDGGCSGDVRELRRGDQRRGSGPRERDCGSPGGEKNKPSSPKVPPLKIILPSKSPTAKETYLPYIVNNAELQAEGTANVAASAAVASAAAAGTDGPSSNSSGGCAGPATENTASTILTATSTAAPAVSTAQPPVAVAAAVTAAAAPALAASVSHKDDEASIAATADVEEKETFNRRTLRSHTHSMQQRMQQQQQQQQHHSHQHQTVQQQTCSQQQQQQPQQPATQQPATQQQPTLPPLPLPPSQVQPPQALTAGLTGTISSTSTPCSSSTTTSVEENINIHPRKRKLRPRQEPSLIPQMDLSSGSSMHTNNPYQLSAELRKEVWKKREQMFTVAPKPPSQFQDYLISNRKYLLAGNDRACDAGTGLVGLQPPATVAAEPLRELFVRQEDDRQRLRLNHQVEKEKLILAIEQETLRVHGRAARALASQDAPLGFCTILRDTEIYNVYHPFHVRINVNKEEDRDRNTNRSHYNNRQFLSWLQDVDDKFEKIKESTLLRQRHEAGALYAVQRMDWEWKLKELGLCDYQTQPVIDATHVPLVSVSDDIELLPA